MIAAPGPQPLGLKSQASPAAGTGADELATLPLFSGLDRASVQRIADVAAVRHCRNGEVLWVAGAPIDSLVIVLSGQFRALRAIAGRQHVIHSEGAGGTLGEVALFAGGAAPATVVASSAGRCLVVPRSALDRLVAQDPAIAWLFLHRLADRVRGLVDRLDALALLDATARVARFLIDRAPGGAAAVPIGLGMTQGELAEELGTVREVVVRAFRTLRRQGAIRPAGHGRVMIADADKLRVAARLVSSACP